MSDGQRIGGIGALVAAGTFIVGLVMFVTVVSDYTTGDPDAAESVQFLVDNEVAMYGWNIVIFIVFGIALVPLVLAIHERLAARSASLAPVATAFGLIWVGLVLAAGMVANVGWADIIDLHGDDPAQAAALWRSVDAVQNGLGGGNELVGGLWVLLLSGIALRAGSLPRWLCYLGIAAGTAGLLTVIPPLEAVGAVFGIGLIVWFLWIGALMIRESDSEARRTRPDTSRRG